jgi:hypothetical protein
VRPLGFRHPAECSLPDFVNLCRLGEHFTRSIGQWQVTSGARNQTWNLLSMLDVEGQPGLLLVEASAHADELNGTADQAVAATYLVASCGLHAVLLLLGFTGDEFFQNHFAGSDAFAAKARGRLARLLSPDDIGKRVPHKSGGSMSILIGTLPVIEVSGKL